MAEDAANPGLLRQGVARPVEFDAGMGQWIPVPAGGWLWVLDVKAPGMYGVRLHFADFALPKDAEMIVYDPTIPNNLPAPYRMAGLLGTGEFWAWASWSNTARVEVYYPPQAEFQRLGQHFTIDQAVQMYRNPLTGQVEYAYGEARTGLLQRHRLL